MKLNEVRYSAGQPVEGYGAAHLRVDGAAHAAPVALLPRGVTPWTGYGDAAPLLAAAGEIDVLLIGTGPEIAQVPAEFRTALEAAGIGVEIMATAQACRTYNVLLGEGRRVGLAILPAG